MKKLNHRSECPISFSLDFLGDKWTLLIIRDIFAYGKTTYKDFLNSDEKIATNILADRLATLEKYGFVERRISEAKKSSVNYFATEKTIDLIPVIMELNLWGNKYSPTGYAGLIEELKKDKAGTIKYYQDKLRKVLAEIA